MRVKLYIFVFILFITQVKGQTPLLDSLKECLKKELHDSVRLAVYASMTDAEADDNIWPKYNAELKNISEKGLAALKSSDPGFAAMTRCYKRCLALYFNNESFIYNNRGDLPTALDYLMKGLKINEEIGLKKGIAMAYSNIGSIYETMADTTHAYEYYMKAFKIQEEMGDLYGMSISYNNIGVLYDKRRNGVKAREFFEKALELMSKTDKPYEIAQFTNNLGFVYERSGYLDKALELYNKGLKIREELNDKKGLVESYNFIAYVYTGRKEYGKAESLYKKSMSLARELGFPLLIREVAKCSAISYRFAGKFSEGLAMYELFLKMNDSIVNAENRKQGMKKQLQYEYEKKALADSVRVAEEKKVIRLRLEEEKNQRYALYGGLILVIGFAGFIFNLYKVAKSQKKLIEQKERETQMQKELIEAKQKEILDSIYYARRIQSGLMPTENQFRRILANK